MGSSSPTADGDSLRAEAPIEAHEIAAALARAAAEKKAADIVLLDMRELVDYCDVFIICTARNRRQVQAIAEEVRRAGKLDLGLGVPLVEGLTAGRWVLVDFGAVVLHVFDGPLRGFYDLDGLWSDAPKIEVEGLVVAEGDDPTEESQPAP